MVSKVEIRVPVHPRCPICRGQLSIDNTWQPPAGYDPNIRKYYHPNTYCRYVGYYLTSLKDAPTGVK